MGGMCGGTSNTALSGTNENNELVKVGLHGPLIDIWQCCFPVQTSNDNHYVTTLP
jgi:hypothetical protein